MWIVCSGDECQAEWPAPFNVSVPAADFNRVLTAVLSGGCPAAEIGAVQELYGLGTWKADTFVNVMGMMLTDTNPGGMGSCAGMNNDAATMAAHGMPSYLWVLARRPAAQPWYVGACHGSEQAFVFGNPRWMWYKDQAFTPAGELKPRISRTILIAPDCDWSAVAPCAAAAAALGSRLAASFAAAEAQLSAEMQAAFVRFADTGNPGWATYKPNNSTRIFDVGQQTEQAAELNYNHKRCYFWASAAGKRCRLPSWSAIETKTRQAMHLLPPPPPPPPPHVGNESSHWMMGWNSWDSLGTAVNETNFLEHCTFMSKHLLEFGYDHCMVDAGWSAQGPAPGNTLVDPHGRPLPNPRLWPSAGPNGSLGFAPVAERVHEMGLKFGFHFWRGILPAAVAAKSPVLGAPGYSAADIVMAAKVSSPGYTDDTCRNDAFSHGINMSHPAAQPFYDSLAELWTEWGTDSVKVDCNRLKWTGARQEVFGLAAALEKAAAKSKRQGILYELSPGGDSVCGSGCGSCNGRHNGSRSTPCNPALQCNASAIWRSSIFRMDHGIDGDWVNGSWVIPTTSLIKSSPAAQEDVSVPFADDRTRLGDVHDRWARDIVNQFPVAAAWAAHRLGPASGQYGAREFGLYGKRARAYIDMVPVGEMSSNNPRGNKMSPSQQQVAYTLWAVLGSPLVLGTALLRMSAETLALVTNREVINMAKTSASTRQLWWAGVHCKGATGKHAGVPCAATTAWEVVMPGSNSSRYYALFNLGPRPHTLRVETEETYGGALFDVWRQQPNGTTDVARRGSFSRVVAANSTLLLRFDAHKLTAAGHAWGAPDGPPSLDAASPRAA